MKNDTLVRHWFELWAKGNFRDLPLSSSFTHTSPFGIIQGRDNYLNIVETNKEKFLGYQFEIKDMLHGVSNSCVRYIGKQGDFELEVSEWFYFKDGLIDQIVSYYHIGEIREDRSLDM